MNELIILEKIESYLKNEMSLEDRVAFEQLRLSNPEIDQLVVSHASFLTSIESYGNIRSLKHSLPEIHRNLENNKRIQSKELGKGAKIINFVKRYPKTISIAASIAGVTAFSISGMTLLFSPKSNIRQVQELVKTVDALKSKQNQQDKRINHIANANKLPEDKAITGIGSAFIIDQEGILVTNAHVVRNAKGVIVTNHEGQEFNARILSADAQKDLAFLKIEDSDFFKLKPIPYGIRKQTIDLAEPIFTLGYPDNKFVYGEGYMSSSTGHDGDTLNCQIAVAANPGNSGGPVFNKSGEVIGILSTREMHSDGVVYAIRSKYLLETIQELKNSNPDFTDIKLNQDSRVRGMDKVQQVKRFQDYVYMLKVY
ncbi:MAG: S1C family serine protease [Bacteroidetes bacterium]|nr:S1C family serine protease [Bacteroidota bacterium]